MTLNYRTFLNLVTRKREGGRGGEREEEGGGREEEGGGREGGIMCIAEGRRWRV